MVKEELTAKDGPEGVMPLAATTDAYEQIAQLYFERWRDRSAIHHHLKRFVEMLRANGLARFPVADIGCGPGFDGHYFRQAGLHVVGLDLSMAMMRTGRQEYGGPFVQADMRALPLADSMGGLWVSASLLHMPRGEVPGILTGFAKALAPGGLLYLSLKAGQGSEWTGSAHGQSLPRYFVYWQPSELDTVLQQAGFQVVDGWASSVSESTTWLIRFARKNDAGQMLSLNLA